MTGYAVWAAGLRDLGLRHTAELLAAPGGRAGFRVLDGLWYPTQGMRWARVDREYVRGQRERRRLEGGPGEPVAAALLDRADDVLAADPMGLRRIVLYELALLLQDHPLGTGAQAAEDLGVDPAEAAELAAAVSVRQGRLDGEAAEGIQEAWESGRLGAAVRFADRLPRSVGDPPLRGLLEAVRALRRKVDRTLDEAGALERAGETQRAAGVYLRAARWAVDEPRAVTGLLRTAAAAQQWQARVASRPEGVTVTWDPAPDRDRPPHYRMVRHPEGRPDEYVDIGAPVTANHLLDGGAVPGTRVCYAVLPMRGERIAGRPRVSAPLLVAPEVEELALTAGRGGVTGSWRAPAGATAVRALRADRTKGASGTEAEVVCHRDGFEDGYGNAPLPPGEYAYRVFCEYPGPDGRPVRSPGIPTRATVEQWPDPVDALTAEQDERTGAVWLAWAAPEHGEVRLVPWAGAPPDPGADLSAPLVAGQLAPSLPSARLDPERGSALRAVAVTVLGRRAVAGPSVLVESQRAVTGITADRGPGDSVRLSFDWPEPAAVVTVGWRQGGRTSQRRVVRSAYLREGISLPVNGQECVVWVAPVPVEGADFVVSGEARVRLPSQVRVTYRVLKSGWRAGTRRTVEVRAVLPGPGPVPEPGPGPGPDPAAEEVCPDFLLVGRESIAPLSPRQGTEELCLAGDRLAAGEPVRTEIDLRDRVRPYLLRGFLRGADTTAAQLEHPPPETLVVR
ncbi:hypothetical protein OG607_33175 [Streptomyces sp. NBC_01537]|uniref:hypothetical protein n=1 Tax=Streptomyces sp. NBC_01537 TaxID=2903896 RepID=UPI003870B9DD